MYRYWVSDHLFACELVEQNGVRTGSPFISTPEYELTGSAAGGRPGRIGNFNSPRD